MQRTAESVGVMVGDTVKIYDIGPMAEVLEIGQDQFHLRLDGDEFWCPACIIDFPEEEE